MKKIYQMSTVAILALGLTACGGGSSDGGSSDGGSTGGDTPITTTYYSACLTKSETPTYNCALECNSDEFQYAQYTSEAECQTEAAAFVTSFVSSDTPRTTDHQYGFDMINDIRANVGMPRFKYNSALERAAANHENYIGDVADTYNVNVTHYEYDEYPSDYFTGYYPTDRALYEGYEGFYAGDVISYGNLSTYQSIDGLMSAIYHRQAIFWTFLDEIGIGGLEKNFNFKSQPHLMGSRVERINFLGALSPEIICYPYSGETNVRRIFYEELPDPLPDYSVSGNPISVTFNSYYVTDVDVKSFKLYDESAGNIEVTNTRYMDVNNDPNGRFSPYDFALFPLDVLESSHTYRVEVAYVADGEAGTKVWSFTTRSTYDRH